MQIEYRIFLKENLQDKVYPLLPYHSNKLGFYIDIIDDIIDFIKEHKLLIVFGEIFTKIDENIYDYDVTGFTHWEYKCDIKKDYNVCINEAIDEMKRYLTFVSSIRNDRYLISLTLYDKYSIYNLNLND